MSDQRSHYITTNDGVTIGAAVHGRGPTLVFVHGVIGDGDLDWNGVVGHLSDRFTCHLPSLRGRGLSGDHPDLRLGRLVDDTVAYVDSIGDSTRLVGWSLGADLALAVAGTQPDAVDALVAVDPVLPRLLDAQEQAAFGAAVARMAALAAEGKLAEAARAFAGFPFTDGDIAAANDVGYFEAASRYVPTMLDFFGQQKEYGGPTPDHPALLRAITAPVLVSHGSGTKPYGTVAPQHIAQQVSHARVHEIPDAGHAAPLSRPEPLAEAIAEFFAPARTRT